MTIPNTPPPIVKHLIYPNKLRASGQELINRHSDMLITNNKNIFGNVEGILYLCIMISETLIARAFGGLMLVVLLSTLI